MFTIYMVLGVWYYEVQIRFVGGIMNCKFGSVCETIKALNLKVRRRRCGV